MYRWASIAKYPGVQNFFGFPGLSVPIGFDSVSGLPMAMQITTLTGEEALGFRIGCALCREACILEPKAIEISVYTPEDAAVNS